MLYLIQKPEMDGAEMDGHLYFSDLAWEQLIVWP